MPNDLDDINKKLLFKRGNIKNIVSEDETIKRILSEVRNVHDNKINVDYDNSYDKDYDKAEYNRYDRTVSHGLEKENNNSEIDKPIDIIESVVSNLDEIIDIKIIESIKKAKADVLDQLLHDKNKSDDKEEDTKKMNPNFFGNKFTK